MFISDISIKRPVFATVLILALVTLGLFSYRRLPIDMWPNVDIPVITISTVLEGAAPETIEREVSRPIEEAVNAIPGVKHVRSISRESISLVVVEFHLEVQLNDVAQEARTKINAIRGHLPEEIKEPIIQKIDVTNTSLVSLALRSDTLDPRSLTTLAEKKVIHRLENIPGIGKVNLVGTAKREINIYVHPDRLTEIGMGVDELLGGIQREHLNIPLGRLRQNNSEYPLRVTGKNEAVEDFKTMQIARRGDRPVLLGELAEIIDGVEEPDTAAYVNREPAVTIDLFKQSGANAVEVADRVRKTITDLRRALPAGVDLDVVRDSSRIIRQSVDDVQETIVIGALLTVLIVFLFLNSWRSTVITGLTLPVSVISSFIIMNMLGMTLNFMTLMALSLSIGLLIDDAIVVRENIVRHLEKDHDHMRAAREGTNEIGLAVMATTFSIIAVFVPVAYMKGIIGRFFFHFGITVAFAVLVSLLVSFTLDPMLSSRWLDPDVLDKTARRGFLTRWLDRFNRAFDRLADFYRRLVRWALKHRAAVVMLAFLAFVGGLFLMTTLEQNFIPIYDQNEFLLKFKSAPNASLDETRNRVQAVMSVLERHPEVESTYTTIGAGDWGTARDAAMYVRLVDKKKRRQDQFTLMAEIRRELQQVAGVIPSLEDCGRMDTRKPLLISVRGDDLEVLKKYAARIKAGVATIPGIVDVELAQEQDIPEYRLMVDRPRATDAGLSTAAIARTLNTLVNGSVITTFEDEDGDAVDVRVRLPLEMRENPAQLNNLLMAVHDPAGRTNLIPLSNVVSYTMGVTPSEVSRYGLMREALVSTNLDRLPLGSAIKQVKPIVAEATRDMPAGYRVFYYGESEDMAESFGYMAESLILAIVFVYLILAAQFESFVHPFSIMLSLPLSIVGMVGMLRLAGDTLNIMSLIGLILLMGLVTKNAILLVDYANVLRAQGLPREEALIQAGRTRLRPILMTTLAMIFGMLPLSLALGAGSEMRAPMGRAVIGGLITSTLLTLLVVPVFYTLLEDVINRLKRLRAKSAVVPLLLALLLWPRPGMSEEFVPTRRLTLDEALKLTFENNKDILKARESENRVHGYYLEQRAAAFPQITAVSAVSREKDESRAAQGMGLFDVPEYSDFNVAELRLSQVIFTWGQVAAAIRGAKEMMGAADAQTIMAEQGAIKDVSVAFYDILLAGDMHDLALQNISQKQRHLDEARHKYAAGTATDYDVLSSRVALENARPEAIRTDNALALVRERFRFLLALQDEKPDASGTLDVAIAECPSVDKVMETALANRPEVAYLQHNLLMTKEKVIIANSLNKPRLDFKSSYGYRDLTMEQYDDSFNGEGDAWSLGMYLTWPLFDGGRTKGLTAQAVSEAKSLELDIRNIYDTLVLQVRQAVNAVRDAGEIVMALGETVTQAERMLAMAEQGYKYGVMTRLDVDDAALNLLHAQSSLARGKRDYLVARLTLEWTMGKIGQKPSEQPKQP
ncbi:MAG: efflux RND transporter permease subunit [Thermodesulfobacteriota bacterium]